MVKDSELPIAGRLRGMSAREERQRLVLCPISSGTVYEYDATMCCISDPITSVSSSTVPVKGVFSHRPV